MTKPTIGPLENACPGTKSGEHQFEKPFPNKELEYCSACNLWLVHTGKRIVYLPPPDVLIATAPACEIDPKDVGQLFEFKRPN